MVCFRAIVVSGRINIRFSRINIDGEEQITEGGFSVPPQSISEWSQFDLDGIAQNIDQQIEHFNSNGSGWQVVQIVSFSIKVAPYRPCQGSSYIPTPKCIKLKKCCVNVVNVDDNKCFIWSVLAQIRPVESSRYRKCNYTTFEQTLNVHGLHMPMQVRDIPKFENLNRDISVNVLYFDEDDKSICPLYITKQRDRLHHVNLLLPNEAGQSHYILVTNLSRLVKHRTKHNGKTFVCPYCLTCLQRQSVYDKHLELCKKHHPQVIEYPDPSENLLNFTNIQRQYPVPFVIYADLECFLIPQNDVNDDKAKMKRVAKHEPSGFAAIRVSVYPEHNGELVCYSDPDPNYQPGTPYSGAHIMHKFFDYLREQEEYIKNVLRYDKPILKMTSEEEYEYRNAKHCISCSKPFIGGRTKVRHHCHVTGYYLGPCCNICNLQLKNRKWKSFINVDGTISREHTTRELQMNPSSPNSFFIPVYFHNGKNYDFKYVLKHFTKEFATYKKAVRQVRHMDADEVEDGSVDSSTELANITAIPINTKKHMGFQVGGIRFLDSCQF